jgi:plastocyanin
MVRGSRKQSSRFINLIPQLKNPNQIMLPALWTLGLAASATAATIKINVGQSNGLAFGPDTVTAVEGDILEFHFVSGTHQVVSADFAKPCEPVATAGFASPMVQGSATTVSRSLLMLYLGSIGKPSNQIWAIDRRFQSHCQLNRSYLFLLCCRSALFERHGRCC